MKSQEEPRALPLRVALVHDFLVCYGGAERVFEALCEMYPEAPVYTLLYDQERMGSHFRGRDIRVSWLGKLPKFFQKHYRFLLPFFPVAVETLDLREYDLVISSSGAWSKGIITRLHTRHIAYLHSPMRYAWDYHEAYVRALDGSVSGSGRLRLFTRLLMSYLRIWDVQAAARPDVLLVNSFYTQARVQKYYRRESNVVYPPALTLFEKSLPAQVEETPVEEKRTAFLVVSRLTRSKKVEKVIEAFNKLSLPLIIVGVGPEKERLKKLAGKNITFTGFLPDTRLALCYAQARAVIFPAEEDFGMVAVEALSFGTPVIAFEYGGIREIVEEGVTGEFFHASVPEIIAEGVRRFLVHEGQYDRASMQQAAARFTQARFVEGIKKVVEQAE